MTREAVIQGEFHATTKDSKNLLDSATSTTEVVFLEGRSDTILLDESSVGYVLFLIGYLSMEILYKTLDWIRRHLPGEHWDIRKEATSRGMDVEDEIDAELHQTWYLADGLIRKLLYLISMLLVIYLLTNSVWGGAVPGELTKITAVFMAWSIPFVFSAAILLLAIFAKGKRDEIMSESIIDAAEQEDYEDMLILCGQLHAKGIHDRLQEEGWDVEKQDSWFSISKYTDSDFSE